MLNVTNPFASQSPATGYRLAIPSQIATGLKYSATPYLFAFQIQITGIIFVE